MDFSICVECEATVDMKDTFRDTCPMCGCVASWNDDPVELQKRRDWIQQNCDEGDE